MKMVLKGLAWGFLLVALLPLFLASVAGLWFTFAPALGVNPWN